MNTMLRRLRRIAAAERILRILRVFVLLRGLLTFVQTAVMLWKRKGR